MYDKMLYINHKPVIAIVVTSLEMMRTTIKNLNSVGLPWLIEEENTGNKKASVKQTNLAKA